MRFPIPDFLRRKLDEIISENADDFEEEDTVSQEELEKLSVFQALRDSVRDGMTLDALIDAFARMCAIGVGDPDDLLFETGTYDFTGEKLFYFSLVRQFRYRDEDEFVQLHLDVRYQPSPATARLQSTEWGNATPVFFEAVKASSAFNAVKDQPIAQVEVYIDET